MKLGVVKKSDLISRIGWNDNVMRVEYHDGYVADYYGVPLSTAKAIARSTTPGTDWLKLRNQYKFKKV
jgi:hypothetical protein